MSILGILAASVFEIACGKQTDKHTDAPENSTHVTTVSVINVIFGERITLLAKIPFKLSECFNSIFKYIAAMGLGIRVTVLGT